VEGPDGTEHRSLRADSPADEKCVWEDFLGILSEADRPTLLHYGSFEKTFLKKMCERYGGSPEPSAAATAIASATNLLAVIYARIYFPAHSNGLREIARLLGFEWSDRSAPVAGSSRRRTGGRSGSGPCRRTGQEHPVEMAGLQEPSA
jgi:predicted RecB family nuclease